MRTALVSDVISHFQPSRRFAPRGPERPFHVTSLDFDDTGEYCLVSRSDETIQIYNCKDGKHSKELKSQKYGVDLARFTHHSHSIIYASTKIDDTIRYLSAHDNSYIRYFRGHTAPVTSLCLSPSSDNFVSTGLDNVVRQWDLRSSHPATTLNLTAPYLAAYDPGAIVLAIACPLASLILLYDARQLEAQPFATFDLSTTEATFAGGRAGATRGHQQGDWTKLEFSNDSKKLLVATAGPGHYVLDAYDGPLIAYLPKTNGGTNRVSAAARARSVAATTASAGQRNGNGNGAAVTGTGDAGFSPDGRFVVGGSGEAGMLVWDLDEVGGAGDGDVKMEDAGGSGKGRLFDAREKVLLPSHTLAEERKDAGMCSLVAYNPRHNLIATADRRTVLWVPDLD